MENLSELILDELYYYHVVRLEPPFINEILSMKEVDFCSHVVNHAVTVLEQKGLIYKFSDRLKIITKEGFRLENNTSNDLLEEFFSYSTGYSYKYMLSKSGLALARKRHQDKNRLIL